MSQETSYYINSLMSDIDIHKVKAADNVISDIYINIADTVNQAGFFAKC